MGPELYAGIQTFTSMTKRRFVVIAFLVAAPLVIVSGFSVVRDLMAPIEPGATEANFSRIMEGMTLTEVRAIMGQEDQTHHAESRDLLIWRKQKTGYVEVLFDHGEADNKVWISLEEPLFTKLGRLLGL
jgi:hypothetical protein